MGHRLSRICTRTGDDGTTGLGDGARVPKTHPRIAAIGSVDELNALIGVVRAEAISAATDNLLASVQHDLFDVGGELSLPNADKLRKEHAARLEQQVEALSVDLPHLKEFILPGGCRAAALCHRARTVCRRAEREVVALRAAETVNEQTLHYLNRLSDLLFVLARVCNREAGVDDVLWEPGRSVTE